MNPDRFENLSAFLVRLEEAKISFQVARNRYDAVSVMVAVPGQRWEVDFLADGDVEVERFVSSGQIDDESALEDWFARFAEPPASESPSIESNGLVTH